eukprot:gene16036-22174_t
MALGELIMYGRLMLDHPLVKLFNLTIKADSYRDECITLLKTSAYGVRDVINALPIHVHLPGVADVFVTRETPLAEALERSIHIQVAQTHVFEDPDHISAVLTALINSVNQYITDSLDEFNQLGWKEVEKQAAAGLAVPYKLHLHDMCSLKRVDPEDTHKHFYSDKGVPAYLLPLKSRKHSHEGAGWLVVLENSKMAALAQLANLKPLSYTYKSDAFTAVISSSHPKIGTAQRWEQQQLPASLKLTKGLIRVYSHVVLVAAGLHDELGGKKWEDLLHMGTETFEKLNRATLLLYVSKAFTKFGETPTSPEKEDDMGQPVDLLDLPPRQGPPPPNPGLSRNPGPRTSQEPTNRDRPHQNPPPPARRVQPSN